HPGSIDDRVVLGPGTDVTGQRHRVPRGVHRDVAVAGDQRPPVQRVLDQEVHAGRVGVGGDGDVVFDVAHAGQPGDRRRGGSALRAVCHGAGQRQVALAGGRLDAAGGGDGDGRRQRGFGRGGRQRVRGVVTWWQRDLEVVVHVLDAADALRGGGRLQVLRVTGARCR